MGTFEKFCPRLRPGQSFVSDEREAKVIFELEDGSRQVTLPSEASTFLPLMDGKHSVQEMIDHSFNSTQRVPFKSLISTIEKLRKSGCFENDNEAPTSEFETRAEIFDKSATLWERPFYSIPVLRRWSIGAPSRPAFLVFACSSLALTVGFLCLFLLSQSDHQFHQGLLGNAFLRIDGSYLKGIVFFILTTSILVTCKTLFKALLALLVAGRISNIRLEFNLYSLALRMHDEAIYLSSNRVLGALSATVVGLSQFFFFAIVAAVAHRWEYLNDLFLVSVILAMVDLNPYRKSELTSFFNVVYNKDSISHLLPYLKKRSLMAAVGRGEKVANETIYTVYSTMAILWTIVAFNLAIAILNHNYANLLAGISNPDVAEKVSATLILGGTFVVSAYLIFDIGRTIVQNLLYPLISPLMVARAKKSSTIGEMGDVKARAEKIHALPVFNHIRAEAIEFLLGLSSVRKLTDGSSVIVQGTTSDELFILTDGEVQVLKRHATGGVTAIATLKAITAFGENTLLDGKPRSADIVARGTIEVIAIPKNALDQLKAQPEFQTDHEALIDRLRIGQYISASELFKEAPSEAVGLFLNEGEILHVATDTCVIQQGQTDKDFYLLVRGEVKVDANGHEVTRLHQGDFFGEMALLLNHPRSASVTTIEDCIILKLSADKFWQVISQHVSLALFLETVSELRLSETTTRLEKPAPPLNEVQHA